MDLPSKDRRRKYQRSWIAKKRARLRRERELKRKLHYAWTSSDSDTDAAEKSTTPRVTNVRRMPLKQEYFSVTDRSPMQARPEKVIRLSKSAQRQNATRNSSETFDELNDIIQSENCVPPSVCPAAQIVERKIIARAESNICRIPVKEEYHPVTDKTLTNVVPKKALPPPKSLTPQRHNISSSSTCNPRNDHHRFRGGTQNKNNTSTQNCLDIRLNNQDSSSSSIQTPGSNTCTPGCNCICTRRHVNEQDSTSLDTQLVLQILNKVRSELKQIGQDVNKLTKDMNHFFKNSEKAFKNGDEYSSVTMEDILPHPMNLNEDLVEWDKRLLRDDEYRRKVASVFKGMGVGIGKATAVSQKQINKFIKEVLASIATMGVWELYNRISLKGIKLRFVDLHLYLLLKRVCKAVLKDKYTQQMLDQAISEALRTAPSKRGGSKYQSTRERNAQRSVLSKSSEIVTLPGFGSSDESD